jgi:TonB family protein
MSLLRALIGGSLVLTALFLQGCGLPKGVPTDYGSDANGANALARRCGPPPNVPRYIFRDPNFRSASVLVKFRLLAPNEVTEVKVQRSSGIDVLDEAAVEAVSKWRCAFPESLGRPATVEIPFVFNQEGYTPPPTSIRVLWAGEITYDSRTVTPDATSVTGYRGTWVGLHLGEATTKIAAKRGKSFGIRFQFDDPVPDAGITYRIVWRFPEKGLVNPATRMRHFAETNERRCRAGQPCTIGWTFAEDWEMVDGNWTVEIWRSGSIVASQVFEVTTE